MNGKMFEISKVFYYNIVNSKNNFVPGSVPYLFRRKYCATLLCLKTVGNYNKQKILADNYVTYNSFIRKV